MSSFYDCGERNSADSCNYNEKLHEASSSQFSKRSSKRNVTENVSNISSKSDQNQSGATENRNYYKEITEQIRIFQGQCSSLKDKLSQVKGGQREDNSRSTDRHKQSSSRQGKRSHEAGDAETKERKSNPSMKPSQDYEQHHNVKPSAIRQASKAIGTDTSGDAVNTINNILHGITYSVNRLSDVKFQINGGDSSIKPDHAPCTVVKRVSKKRVPSQDTGCGPDDSTCDKDTSMESCNASDPIQDDVVDMFYKSSSSTKGKQKKKSAKVSSNKCKNKTSSSSLVSKSRKPTSPTKKIVPEKKAKGAVGQLVRDAEEDTRKKLRKVKQGLSRTSVSRRKAERTSPEGLIELYHNEKLKESDSDEESVRDSKKRPFSRKGVAPSMAMVDMDVVHDHGDVPGEHHEVEQIRSLSPIEEVDCGDGQELSTGRHSMLSRNYELPTIASKMKQVYKSGLGNFNFQSIPFIASTSTSPSHNLGINIQQVMSIFKTKHPVNGVSPTLVHNLGVAAHRITGRPYSALLSNLGSRLGNRIQRMNYCPLNNRMNFSQLQEMAKDIPEEYEFEDRSHDCERDGMYEKAAGDQINQRMWQGDAIGNHCTCVPPQGLDIEEVLVKNQQQRAHWNNSGHFQSQNFDRFTANPRNRRVQSQSNQRTYSINKGSVSKHVATSTTMATMQERGLKEVLQNLHNEFENMNNKYEELEKRSKDGNKKVLMELEQLEKDLTKKEEEIEVVMNLYNEVTTLKKQLRIMKQRESVQRLSSSPSRLARRQPKAAHHLTKLLRQIQNYQQVQKGIGVGDSDYY